MAPETRRQLLFSANTFESGQLADGEAFGGEHPRFCTTFKVYRRETIKDVRLYGELHRFIPALASLNGAKVIEVPIRNVPRPQGKSHYGISRTSRVFFDLITIRFLLRYML